MQNTSFVCILVVLALLITTHDFHRCSMVRLHKRLVLRHSHLFLFLNSRFPFFIWRVILDQVAHHLIHGHEITTIVTLNYATIVCLFLGEYIVRGVVEFGPTLGQN